MGVPLLSTREDFDEVGEALGAGEDDARPAAVGRLVAPPLATARAAAASAALDPERDCELEDDEPAAAEEPAPEEGRALGRDPAPGRLPLPVVGRPLADPPEALEAGEVEAGESLVDDEDELGRDGALEDGAAEDEVDRGVEAGADDEDDGRAGAGRREADPAAVEDELDGAGVVPEELEELPVVEDGAGEDDEDEGLAGAVDTGVVAEADAAEPDPSDRVGVGRTRVLLSSLTEPSLGLLALTLGDASVVTGAFPPPAVCGDALSDPWGLSALTPHLHVHAAEMNIRFAMRYRPTGLPDPPVRPILASRTQSNDSSPPG